MQIIRATMEKNKCDLQYVKQFIFASSRMFRFGETIFTEHDHNRSAVSTD